MCVCVCDSSGQPAHEDELRSEAFVTLICDTEEFSLREFSNSAPPGATNQNKVNARGEETHNYGL